MMMMMIMLKTNRHMFNDIDIPCIIFDWVTRTTRNL